MKKQRWLTTSTIKEWKKSNPSYRNPEKITDFGGCTQAGRENIQNYNLGVHCALHHKINEIWQINDLGVHCAHKQAEKMLISNGE